MDELVKRLRELKEMLRIAQFNEAESLIKEAADAIEELEKQLREEKVDNVNLTGWLAEEHAKHLWVPVSERLPEDEDVQYLVCEKRAFGNGFFLEIANYAKDLHKVDKYDFPPEDVNGFYRYDIEWGYYKLLFITHWMTLPQPPKGEEE